ncbi:pantothenate synthetase [Bacteroidia bacterium]|nr:pantothenate synthetase [Bacteroidia bacterium]
MEVVNSKNELTLLVGGYMNDAKTIGFVPTMGALHEGHLSLVSAAKKNCDIVVVSIFVNPTQFNDPEDLKRYPRTPEQDFKLLEEWGCDVVFHPSVGEIYPQKDMREFDFGYIGTIMEGAKRPGHFNGVAMIVSKLFDIVRPNKAFFGMKDFQQIVIVKKLVELFKYKVEIVECPIVREKSGLALSSRNKFLSEEQKENASHIYKTLKKAADNVAVSKANSDVNKLKKWIADEINRNPFLETEYVEIVDTETLQIITDLKARVQKRVCVAVYVGSDRQGLFKTAEEEKKIRLIDNILINNTHIDNTLTE